ncbi:hypothetical protein B0T21DRAFT_360998 [Apiosordaria backusii]|uniref:Uncharacterized protein n=1 Tax=Apiosordaria backusii TaxID=314023 RepID=A0AA40EMY0_9PEZI|nr:hypothetical protein B0T21DRAFT_360998 [Apiosordaria backusii]
MYLCTLQLGNGNPLTQHELATEACIELFLIRTTAVTAQERLLIRLTFTDLPDEHVCPDSLTHVLGPRQPLGDDLRQHLKIGLSGLVPLGSVESPSPEIQKIEIHPSSPYQKLGQVWPMTEQKRSITRHNLKRLWRIGSNPCIYICGRPQSSASAYLFQKLLGDLQLERAISENIYAKTVIQSEQLSVGNGYVLFLEVPRFIPYRIL